MTSDAIYTAARDTINRSAELTVGEKRKVREMSLVMDDQSRYNDIINRGGAFTLAEKEMLRKLFGPTLDGGNDSSSTPSAPNDWPTIQKKINRSSLDNKTKKFWRKYFREAVQDNLVVVDLLTDLAAWWDFEEAGNVTKVDSHNSLNATVYGSVSSGTGKVGTYSLDGPFSVRCNHASLVVNGTFSVAHWERVQTGSAGIGAMGHNWDAATESAWRFVTQGAGTSYAFEIRNDAGATFSVAESHDPNNSWAHYAAYYDATNSEIGISKDGGAFVTQAVTGTFSDMTNGRYLYLRGWELNAYIGGVGEIDSAGLWQNKVLTADESAYLYNSGSGVSYGDLI